MTKVVNKYRSEYDVNICRPGIWGNPFIIGIDGDRDQVVDKYAEWLPKQQHLMDCIMELKDKHLGCVCKPKRCHGDVIAEIISRHSAAQTWLL